jgi:hypothetical protein
MNVSQRIDKLLEEIDSVKIQLKERYSSNWRVKVANARSFTDMEVDEDSSSIPWNVHFLDNLKKQL